MKMGYSGSAMETYTISLSDLLLLNTSRPLVQFEEYNDDPISIHNLFSRIFISPSLFVNRLLLTRDYH